jgi:hydrogenase-4 component B
MFADWSLPLLTLAGICLLAGAGFALVLRSWPAVSHLLGYSLAMLASGSAIAGAAVEMVTQRPVAWTLVEFASATPLRLSARLDNLSAFFVALIGIGGLAAALYALGYTRHYAHRIESTVWLVVGLNLFILSMLAVVLADNAFAFLLSWEAMSLTSYLLVCFEHDRLPVRRAGFSYLVATHLGTACLMVAFLLLYTSAGSSFSFDAFRGMDHSRAPPPLFWSTR